MLPGENAEPTNAKDTVATAMPSVLSACGYAYSTKNGCTIVPARLMSVATATSHSSRGSSLSAPKEETAGRVAV